MYIKFKTTSQRDKILWGTLFFIIITSTILNLVMSSSMYKLISIGSSIAIIVCTIILIFFTKTNGVTFYDEKFSKMNNV